MHFDHYDLKTRFKTQMTQTFHGRNERRELWSLNLGGLASGLGLVHLCTDSEYVQWRHIALLQCKCLISIKNQNTSSQDTLKSTTKSVISFCWNYLWMVDAENECNFGFECAKWFTSTVETEGKCSHSLLLHKFRRLLEAKPTLALSPHPALEIGVVWMLASWQLFFTAASWFCALTPSPLSYSSGHFLSLPVPLINIYKIPGSSGTKFCHISKPFKNS